MFRTIQTLNDHFTFGGWEIMDLSTSEIQRECESIGIDADHLYAIIRHLVPKSAVDHDATSELLKSGHQG